MQYYSLLMTSIKEKAIIGQRLAVIRMSKGLTQEDVAEMIGTNAGHISQMETGKRAIGAKSLPKLCEALKISPNDLYLNGLKKEEDVDPLELPWVIRATIELMSKLPDHEQTDFLSKLQKRIAEFEQEKKARR